MNDNSAKTTLPHTVEAKSSKQPWEKPVLTRLDIGLTSNRSGLRYNQFGDFGSGNHRS
jgi:hypothetical protein